MNGYKVVIEYKSGVTITAECVAPSWQAALTFALDLDKGPIGKVTITPLNGGEPITPKIK